MNHRILAIFFGLVLTCTSLMGLIPAPAAHAQNAPIQISTQDVQNATYKFLNADAIQGTFGSQTLEFDLDTSGCASNCNGNLFKANAYTSSTGCFATLKAFYGAAASGSSQYTGAGTLDLDIITPGQTGNACQNLLQNKDGSITAVGRNNGSQIPIKIDTSSANIYFYISSDGATITQVLGKSTFSKSTDPNKASIFVDNKPKSSICPDFIVVDPNGSTYTLYEMKNGGGVALPTSVESVVNESPQCHAANSSGNNLIEPGSDVNGDGGLPNIDLPLGQAATNSSSQSNGAAGSSASSTSSHVNCTWSLNPLTWFLCPVLDGLQGIMNWVNVEFDNFLTTKDCYFQVNGGCSQTANALHTAWGTVRTLSLSLIALIALAMVISQAISVGPFDAYTIKKLLPRLLIAAILITLSWSIMGVLVAITNALGDGVRSLILVPFNQLPAPNISGGTLTGVGTGLAAAGSVLGIFGLLTFALSAAIALLVGFFVIMIRQIVILFLAILAPIAIVAYVLPGTNRVWKFWRDSFSGVLLMFPLITGFIAAGAAFARVTAAQGNSTVNQIIAFIVTYIPFFLLPATIRLAGGIISNVSDFVHGRASGGHALLSNVRKGQREKNIAAIRGGRRFKANHGLARRASTAFQTASLAGAGGFTLDVAKRRARMQTARGAHNFDLASEAIEKNAALRAIAPDDDKLWAVQYGKNEQEVRAILAKRAPERFADPAVMNGAVAEVMRVKRELGENVSTVAATRLQGGTGTGYNYGRAGDDMMNAVIYASGDDRSMGGRILADIRKRGEAAGRVDYAGGGFAKQAQVLDQRRVALGGGALAADVIHADAINPYAKPGEAMVGESTSYSAAAARKEILRDVLDSNAGAAIAGKEIPLKTELAPMLREETLGNNTRQNPDKTIGTGLMSGDAKKAAQALASLAAKQDTAAYLPPKNARALDEEVLSQPIPLDELPANIREMISVLPDGTQLASVTYREAIEVMQQKGDPNFLNMRRELGRSGIEQAQNQVRLQQLQMMGGMPGGNPGPMTPLG